MTRIAKGAMRIIAGMDSGSWAVAAAVAFNLYILWDVIRLVSEVPQ